MSVKSTATCPPDPWGDGCTAWRLVSTSGLAVAEEEMPPGTSEHRHVHAHARQFFYVLDGELAMELPQGPLVIGVRQGLEVAPGTPHRAFNASASPVRFLVVSSPTTAGDRTNLE